MGKWYHWKYLKTSQLHPWCVPMFWPLQILHEGFFIRDFGAPKSFSLSNTLLGFGGSGGVLSGFKGLRSEVTIIPTCSFFSDEAHARSGKWKTVPCVRTCPQVAMLLQLAPCVPQDSIDQVLFLVHPWR